MTLIPYIIIFLVFFHFILWEWEILEAFFDLRCFFCSEVMLLCDSSWLFIANICFSSKPLVFQSKEPFIIFTYTL